MEEELDWWCSRPPIELGVLATLEERRSAAAVDCANTLSSCCPRSKVSRGESTLSRPDEAPLPECKRMRKACARGVGGAVPRDVGVRGGPAAECGEEDGCRDGWEEGSCGYVRRIMYV